MLGLQRLLLQRNSLDVEFDHAGISRPSSLLYHATARSVTGVPQSGRLSPPSRIAVTGDSVVSDFRGAILRAGRLAIAFNLDTRAH